MKLYLENVLSLEGENALLSCKKNDYACGQVNESFDSLQYLHLKSHELLYEEDLQDNHGVKNDGYYQKAVSDDQKKLALDVLKRIRPFHQDALDIFVYCHTSFSEDLGTCTSSWLLSQCEWQAKTIFTVQHHGGITLALGLVEMFHWIRSCRQNCRGVVVGTEKIVLPYRRDDFPLAWLSDGAVALTVTTQPTQNVAYEVIAYKTFYSEIEFSWFRASRDVILTKTLELFKYFVCDNRLDGHIIFPGFDDDVMAQFISESGGFCRCSKMGMYIFGLDCLMALNAIPHDGKNINLIFIDPPNALVCLQVKKIIL